MRSPEDVLKQLNSKACNEDYRYERLYRNFFNPEFYLLAYSRIYAKQGNMTPGTDGKTIDGMSEGRIARLIESMKDCSYQPQPARRTYIPKKNGKTRPLGIPSIEDKLVQEVMRLLLESIFEPTFRDVSHGFRPNRSCHTALQQVQREFTSTRWFVEGDIKGCFDNVDHHVLIELVRKRVNDERFIGLLWKFLKAGYMENWEYRNTYSGTPQGSIISPALANIYLHELDVFMATLAEEFERGQRRGCNPQYEALSRKIRKEKKSLENDKPFLTENELKQRLKSIKVLRTERGKLPYGNPSDEEYKRLRYVRYADDFLIGVIGSKEDAKQIKRRVREFLMNTLRLEMSEEKTLVTHGRDFARFLGYKVTTTYSVSTKKTARGVRQRTHGGTIALYIPKEAWISRLKEYGALKISRVNNKEVYKPVHRPYLLHLDDLEILNLYNAEIRGLYNYYRLANNACVLNKYMYVMRYSMYKTFAAKYRTRVSRIIAKYRAGDDFAVRYQTKKGPKTAVLYNGGFKRDTTPARTDPDKVCTVPSNLARTSLIARLQAGTCEWCGAKTEDIEIHHVRKLKDLSGKKAWERRMIERNRKTLALCAECHHKLHAGKLN